MCNAILTRSQPGTDGLFDTLFKNPMCAWLINQWRAYKN